ncbi:acyltransferase family protein [Melittangium boletus]|uniref:acyltransferase family protein n=1 Tax=Melittangium boletus TaxID=83453 RepID=UPI003DA65496
MTSQPAPVAAPRDHGLDRARAVAVIAMVMGHTLDAVLKDTARQTTGMLVYWSFRAVTAPLFLFVAGWAFATTVRRTGLGGPRLLRRYLPRVGLLLFWGYFLRWPGWGLPAFFAGDPKVWQHFLAFDALHGVAGALLMGALVLAAVRPPAARLAVLGGLALLVPWVSPWMRAAVNGGPLPLALTQALAGTTSAFPLFPWSAYFLMGGVTGLALGEVKRAPHWLVLCAGGTGLLALLTPRGEAPGAGDLPLVLWRLGLVALVAGLAMRLPARLDGMLGPVGRASLWVYVAHLPLAYGWSTLPGLASRVGRTQDALPALGLALGVLALCLAVTLPLKKAYGAWRKRAKTPPGVPHPRDSQDMIK